MKVTMTARLRLLTTPEQFQALYQTHIAYRDALYAVSCSAHAQLRNQQRLQCECDDDIRLRSGFPTLLAYHVLWQGGGVCKGVWAQARKSAGSGRAGWTRKCSRGPGRAPYSVSPRQTSNNHRDSSPKEGQRVSILASSVRVILPSIGYDKHVALLAREARPWYDSSRKPYYLLIFPRVGVADPRPQMRQRVSEEREPAFSGACGLRGPQHIFLCWLPDVGQGQVVCATEETVAGERHSRSDLGIGDARGARETVETQAHPYAQSAHCGSAPTPPYWPGQPDSSRREHHRLVRPAGNQEVAMDLHRGLCRLARPADVPRMRIRLRARGCMSRARTAGIGCLPISSAQETSQCVCCASSKTGCVRASCQYAQGTSPRTRWNEKPQRLANWPPELRQRPDVSSDPLRAGDQLTGCYSRSVHHETIRRGHSLPDD